ncbi:MAG: hypothetical protein MJZ12_06405 [Prevotella sp.]|nr:hypothetical protein [Prevotella sp.]
MSKNKNIYIVPRIEVESMETASFIAGSIGIGSGGPIGGGNHGINGAKSNTILYSSYVMDDETEEDVWGSVDFDSWN